jgi:hypothetical protein
MPFERTYAVNNARKFLHDLLNPKVTPKVPKAIRDKARSILRHYPSEWDMDEMFLGRRVFDPAPPGILKQLEVEVDE